MNSAKTKIVPLADRVVVRPGAPEDAKKTKSGIIIPETVDKEKPEEGEVIAVGPGRTTDEGKLIPMGLKIGDRVIFSKYGPDEVKVEGVKYYIIREEAVLAVIK